jgi:hypothetical protein
LEEFELDGRDDDDGLGRRVGVGGGAEGLASPPPPPPLPLPVDMGEGVRACECVCVCVCVGGRVLFLVGFFLVLPSTRVALPLSKHNFPHGFFFKLGKLPPIMSVMKVLLVQAVVLLAAVYFTSPAVALSISATEFDEIGLRDLILSGRGLTRQQQTVIYLHLRHCTRFTSAYSSSCSEWTNHTAVFFPRVDYLTRLEIPWCA